MMSLRLLATLFLLISTTALSNAQTNDRFKVVAGFPIGNGFPFFRLDRYTGNLEACKLNGAEATVTCDHFANLPTDPGNTKVPEFDITVASPGGNGGAVIMSVVWYNIKTGNTAACYWQRFCNVPK